MGISNESKDLIKAKIEELQASRVQLSSDIQALKERRDALAAHRDAVVAQITKLQGDLA